MAPRALYTVGKLCSVLKLRNLGIKLDKELAILKKLNTPRKVQDFLGTIRINFETDGDTCLSPRRMLRERRAHCIEAAMLAAAAFWVNGEPPLLFDLRSVHGDDDHVVALFKQRGRWGAVSKSNHIVLRYREPIFRTIRELALSYFHEYVDKRGVKTLREYSSKPFDLRRYPTTDWMTSEENVWFVAEDIDMASHTKILLPGQERSLRKADPLEMKLDGLVEWPA